jgi:oligoribonuclease
MATQSLIFLDTETSGLDSRVHVPLDIALYIVDAKTNMICRGYQSLISCSEAEFKSGEADAFKVNGLTYEEVKTGRTREQVRADILQIFSEMKLTSQNARFVCQNPTFDRSFMNTLIDVKTQHETQFPYHWLDLASMYWMVSMIQLKVPASLKLDAIAKSLGVKAEPSKHTAIGGVTCLYACYTELCKALN